MIKSVWRSGGLAVMALIVALFTALPPNAVSYAQDTTTVTIDGSAIVSPILKAASQSYATKHPDAKITVGVSGTEGGFDKLCSGALDVNMAAKAITDQQAAACQGKNINFVELLLGYDALVVIVNNSSEVTCITPDQMNKLLSPSSTGIKNWNAVDPALPSQPITGVYVPPADSQAYILADSLVPGDKLRSDATVVTEPSQVGAKVAGDVTGVGIVKLADANNLTAAQVAARPLQLKADTTCISPSIPNLESARYPAAEPLYLYINSASLDKKPVTDFLNYLLSSDGINAVSTGGFVTASSTTYARGLNYLAAKQIGRTFSRIENINVPSDTSGAVTMDGAGDAYPVLKALSNDFNPRYTKITVTTTAFGTDGGYRKLCSSATPPDVVGAVRLPTSDELAGCQKANIQTLNLKLGAQGVAIVVNAKDTFAQCLTTDQIGKLFNIDADKKILKWSDVDPSFPATALTLLTPPDGAPETDLLLSKTVKAVAPVLRTDTQGNSDAEYRAAATQNVDGGIAYMTFADYQTVKSKVLTVQVNSGSGCVAPTADTLKDGTYPLSETLYAVLNVSAFSRTEMKAFAWYLLSDDALAVIGKQNLVGTDSAAFIAAREVALAKFAGTGTSTTPVIGGTAAATASATGAATSPATSATAAATSAQ